MDFSSNPYSSSYFRPRQPPASPLTLISFYNGTSTDSQGRTLDQILGWNANRLESSHDYIQTLFPLPEVSGVNDRAPIIDREVFDAFRSDPELRGKLRMALEKMCWFYGFEITTSTSSSTSASASPSKNSRISITPGPAYPTHSRNWNTTFDHNHLRITRIIRCLRVLGLEEEARAFYDAVVTNGTRVSSRSKMYWRRAVERGLHVAPDVGDGDAHGDGRGVRWLWEFEREKEGEAGAVVDGKSEQEASGEGEKDRKTSPEIDSKGDVEEETEDPESIPETASTEPISAIAPPAAEKDPSKDLEVHEADSR